MKETDKAAYEGSLVMQPELKQCEKWSDIDHNPKPSAEKSTLPCEGKTIAYQCKNNIETLEIGNKIPV